ncbi:retrovirus-related pol polyprotein from transposon TNT 1-94 [Tanacetum coccineum]|uniref:Retrovirus-related pol polyprotein from transposon TNT 1-94 n=1 Tax=Tanacetum coccineum TaxID=301880 RepID=A0ABQ5AER1_9ASTR
MLMKYVSCMKDIRILLHWKRTLKLYTIPLSLHNIQVLQLTQQSQVEFPQLDSGLTVPTFQQGDDPIDCINKAMAFLSAVVSRGIATTSRGNYAASQAKVVKCYNCLGEGHMAKQCTQPKRPRSFAWFKEKLILVEAQEAGQMLDEEQFAFTAEATEDLDVYDSDCDDISSAKAVLMANLSSCDSDVLFEVPSTERVKISSTNVRLETTVQQKEETFQVVIDVLKNFTYFKAFTISAKVLEIFMHQFWYTIKKVKDLESYEFLLANKKCIVDAEVFRMILGICPRVEGEEFTEAQDDDATITFLIDLGYKESYQMFIKYSTGQIPPKKSRGKGSKGKKTANVSQESVDLCKLSKKARKPAGDNQALEAQVKELVFHQGEYSEEDQGDDEEVDWIDSDEDEEKKDD